MFPHRIIRRADELPLLALLAAVHSVSRGRNRRLVRLERLSCVVSRRVGLALLETVFRKEIRRGPNLVVGGGRILHDELVAALVLDDSLRRALGRAGHGRRPFSVRFSVEFSGRFAISHVAVDSDCVGHRRLWRFVSRCLVLDFPGHRVSQSRPATAPALGLAD